MIGQTLGHYRVLKKLGIGGMGEVYRARDEHLDRDVALKVLPAGLLADEKARRSFRNEAQLLARLNHPNIATVHEYATQDGTDFLVMECVEGASLAQKIEGGPLAEKELLALALQIALALEEAHELGIVHRDLKPGNVLITPKGRAKVLDFGLARLLRPSGDSDPTQSASAGHGAVGTLPYMSPEQLHGDPADARSDIFAFGAVLYEMATGRRPSEEKLPSRLIDAILREPPTAPRTINPRISVELERIILKCLEKEPENRYQSAKEVEVDLRRLQAQSSSTLVTTTPAGASSARPLHWRVPAITAAIVAIAFITGLGIRAWRMRHTSSIPASGIHSIAVLPLENLSGDPQQDYFAQGMTEELTTQLAQISALRVTSRTSVTRYAHSPKSLPQIAKELNVDAIVEGSVMKSGDRVRITAQLIEGSTDKLLWAQSYDRNLTDILRLQDEVARAIASEVQVTLTPEEQARLAGARDVNPAAHEAYIKGEILNQGTAAQQQLAKTAFEDALKIDPDYAPAYAGLADYFWSNPGLDPRAAMPEAKQYAEKALALDPNLTQAHTALAAIHFYADWDWAGAESEIRRALELNPSDANAHRTYSYLLVALGRDKEAFAEIQQAQAIDPLNISTQVTAGWVYYFARQPEQAVAQCLSSLDLDANSAGAHDCLGSSYLEEGNFPKSIAESQRASELSGNDPARLVGLLRAYALAGQKSDAQKIFNKLNEASVRGYVPPYILAVANAALGRKDAALGWLDRAFREHDRYMAWLKADPALDSLRSDAQFQTLLKRMNFPPPSESAVQ
jgi:eukaryotic-like serine/threonine-protein kinase